jgi:hypothetical protein
VHKALIAFKHQRVYDKTSHITVPLTPYTSTTCTTDNIATSIATFENGSAATRADCDMVSFYVCIVIIRFRFISVVCLEDALLVSVLSCILLQSDTF